MTLLIDNQQSITADLQELLEGVLEKTLAYLNTGVQVEVSLLLTDNEMIRLLNREYRGRDNATDVLSFPMLDLNPFDREAWLKQLKDNTTPIIHEVVLGDIVISVEKAEVQAGEFGHSLERELGFLMVHGLLHLLGYDHETGQEEEEAMNTLQEAILQQVNLSRG